MKIKEKLCCRIFGHDFRNMRHEEDGYVYTRISSFCRKCGLTKEDLKQQGGDSC